MSTGMPDNARPLDLCLDESNSIAVPATRRSVATLDRTSTGVLRDYLRLTKPRSILPHLITAASAMFLAVKGMPPLHTLLLTLIGGGLAAAASNTLNCYFDRDLDRHMARTRSRPLPAGRIRPQQALTFGVVTGAVGLLVLGRFVGLAAAILAFIALVYYVFAYTLFLKWRAPWNVLIGSGVGGLTPLIGWVAVTNRLAATPFLLSAIIVLWTLPHFWSLAVFRRGDYEQAGIKALPPKGVGAMMTTSSILLVVVSLLLAPAADLGFFYLGIASVLGAGFLYLALQMNRREPLSRAWRFHSYSIIYIALLFIAMIANEVAKTGGKA
jgi:protoheme IX farnesyltransferase